MMGGHKQLFHQRTLFIILFVFVISFVTFTSTFSQLTYISSGVTCHFDRGWCGWRNLYRGDDFNWKRGSGAKGQQKGTGTDGDHGGDGSYLYIKSKNNVNRTARIYSPKITADVDMCFQFWYFMRGKTLGHLEVILGLLNAIGRKTGEKSLWKLWGHQANSWKRGSIPINAGTYGFIIIEAFDWEGGRKGNIFIDDIIILNRSIACESVVPSWAEPSANDVPSSTTNSSSAVASPPTFTIPVTIQNTTQFVPHVTQNNRNSSSTSTGTDTVLLNYSTKPFSTSRTATAAANTILTTTAGVNTKMNNIATTDFKKSTTPNESETDSTISLLTKTSFQLSTTFSILLESNLTTQTSLGQPQQGSSGSSTASIAGGVTIGILCLIFLAVALVYYYRKRKRRQFEKNCSVVMTRMYPDITVNTNISFQKLT